MEKLELVFGRVLSEKRRQQGLTQEQVAERCNLDRKYIYLLEKGKNQPSLRSIFALAAALKMTPMALIAEVQQRLTEHPAE
jgi:transcriptional regulator with XRE-family HTH domain